MEQSELLKSTAAKLAQLQIPYAVVGSFASSVWGESRLTQHIDIVVKLAASQTATLCRVFPAPEFYVSQSAADEAVRMSGQFNVIHPSSGNKIDFMVAGNTRWAAAQIERSKSLPIFPDENVNVAAPEDVILGKLMYYREGGSDKHLRDIAGILKLSGSAIDYDYVDEFASQWGVDEIWQQLRQSLGDDGNK